MIDNKKINAVALPGGTILIFSGLVNALQSDDELLFVIGHEIGHLANRDHLRSLGRTLIFTFIAAVFFGSEDPSALFGTNIEYFLELNKSRDQEFAADDWGLSIVKSASGNSTKAIRFFERLPQPKPDSNQNWNKIKQLFISHPFPMERAKRLRAK